MKKIATITAILLLSLILVTPASALRSAVYFLGQADRFVFHPGSDWSDTDLFDNFEGLMPGDGRTEEIQVRNASNDCDYVKIYLKAEAIDDAEMADFLAQLQMKVDHDDTIIYEATPDQTDGLTDFILLGTYNPGDATTLNVTLEVPITLGSEYMHRTGEVDWTFMAECYVDGEIVEPDEPEPLPVPTPDGPRTLDYISQYYGLLVASTIGLIICIFVIRHLRQQDDK